MKLADARGRFEWEQTSAQMALIVNLLRDPKKSNPIKTEDFNPYRLREKERFIPNVQLSVLKDVFVRRG